MIALHFKNYLNAFYFIYKTFFVLKLLKFLYFPLPLFFTISAIRREGDQVYDVINWLNANLKHILFDILRRRVGLILKPGHLTEY